MQKTKRIGLSLSGGGFRATIYHLGTLKKLKELGILENTDVISTNSGGSITGATYSLFGNDFGRFEEIIRNGVKSSIVKSALLSGRILIPLILTLLWYSAIVYLLFTNFAWLSLVLFISFWIIFLFFQFDILPISLLNEKIYNKYFFKNKLLSDLSNYPELVINSTNLETGRLFTFSKRKMEDSSYRYPKDKGKRIAFKNERFPVARAVAASTCVPFVFTPVKINSSFYENVDDIKRAVPRLVDGGIYDNQGIHKITQENSSYRCDTVIISDAGNMIPFKNRYRNVLALLIRTSDVFMNRIKNQQMIQNLYHNSKLAKREIAYHSLGWDLKSCIPGFIDGIKKGQILEHVLKDHQILDSDISEENWNKIEETLKANIDFDRIIEKANTKEQINIARKVKTNLTPLKDVQINALVNHASLITEIQVRLYCPSLIN